jgi:hypothetical protein
MDENNIPAILKIHGDKIGEVNFQSNVAGTTFIKNSASLLQFLKNKVPISEVILLLFREPENQYDKNAVRVEVTLKGSKRSGKIGYIPKDVAPLLSYVLLYPEKYIVNIHDIHFAGGDELKPNIGIFFEYNILPKN